MITFTQEAAIHNSKIIAKKNYNLTATFNDTTKDSQLEYGSEFKPTEKLASLLRNHPVWNRTKSFLIKGYDIPLLKLDIETVLEDLK